MAISAGISYRSLGSPTTDPAAMAIAVGRAEVSSVDGAMPAANGRTAVPPPGTALADLSSSEFPGAPSGPAAIRLNITFSEGDFEILPGPPGSDITVEGRYAINKVTLGHSMGDLTLTIPSDVRIADDSSNMVIFGGSSGRLRDEDDSLVAVDAATLHLEIKTSMGGVNIRRSQRSSRD